MPNINGNWGVSGFLDLAPEINGKVLNPPAMQVEVDGGFSNSLTPQIVNITGPGSGLANRYYGSNVGGQMTMRGKIQSGASPYPPTMVNVQGNITHTFNKGCSITFPVLLQTVTCTKDEAASDMWQIEAVGIKNGPQVLLWNGKPYSYTAPVLAVQEVFAGTTKMNDPYSITSQCSVRVFLPTPALMSGSSTAPSYTDAARNAAVAAYIAGAAAPMPNLQVVNTIIEPLDDVAVWLVVRWGYTNSSQQIAYRASSSSRSAMQAFRDAVAVVYNSTNTNSTDANSLWATFQSVAYAFRLTVRTINPFTKVAVYEYLNPGIQVQGIGLGGRLVTARLNPSDNTKVQVYVQDCPTAYTGAQIVTFSPCKLNTTFIRDFLVVRLFSGNLSTGAHVPDQGTCVLSTGTYVFPNYRNVNNADFLGIPAAYCRYESATWNTNIALSGTIPFFMGYHLRQDSAGFVAQVPEAMWRRPVTLYPGSPITSGWNNTDDLGTDASGNTVSSWFGLPTQASFDAFTQ